MLRPAGRSIWFQRVHRASNTPAGNPAVLCLFIRLPSGPRVANTPTLSLFILSRPEHPRLCHRRSVMSADARRATESFSLTQNVMNVFASC